MTQKCSNNDHINLVSTDENWNYINILSALNQTSSFTWSFNATSRVHFHSQTKWYNPIQLAVHFHTYNCTHFVKKYIPWKMRNSKRIKTAFSRSYQLSHFSFTLKLYKIPRISLYEIEKSFPYSRIKKNILCPFSFPDRLSLFFTLWLLESWVNSPPTESVLVMTPKNSQLSEVKHLSFTCFPSLYIDKPKRSISASQVIFSVKMLYQAILKPWKITRCFTNNNKRK